MVDSCQDMEIEEVFTAKATRLLVYIMGHERLWGLS